jgi:2-polyprenyl-3-methyl-5-hydroxy-6-metoxy-1,4-benzoquinol methylase
MSPPTFAFNGLVSLKRLNDEWRSAYVPLEKFADRFLESTPHWANKYPWPIDPVHCWFRPFEYPYVTAHLPERSLILDVGTAVTFFPLYLSSLGHRIIATDSDPRMPTFWAAMCRSLPEDWQSLPHNVEYRNSDAYQIPVSEKVDAVTCISVLEHVPDPPRLLTEMLSKLKSGGTLILTMDVSLEAKIGVSAEHFESIQKIIGQSCRPACPDGEVVHPPDLIVWPASPKLLRPSITRPGTTPSLLRRTASRIKRAFVPQIGRSICLYVGTFRKNG